MRTAKEMLSYCKEKKTIQAFSDAASVKHFKLIENALHDDEDVIMCFVGLHNYISMTKNDKNFAYAITNKRILLAQKRLVGEALQSIFLDNINDVTYTKGSINGIITIDTMKEKFNVAMNWMQADKINAEIHEILYNVKQNANAPVAQASSGVDPVTELKNYKELLDSGIITQEEFEAKKKILLNL